MPLLIDLTTLPTDTLPDGSSVSNQFHYQIQCCAHRWTATIAHPDMDEDSQRLRQSFEMAIETHILANWQASAAKGEIPIDQRLPQDIQEFALGSFIQHWRNRIFSEPQRLSLLVDSPALSEHWAAYDRTMSEGLFVGELVLLLMAMVQHHDKQLAGGASIAKAMDFLASERELKRTIARARWSRLKPISHMLAAMLYLHATKPDSYRDEGLAATQMDLMNTAAEIEAFLTSWHAKRSLSPVVPQDALWSLRDFPHNLGLVRMGELPPEWIAKMQQRRAPIPAQ